MYERILFEYIFKFKYKMLQNILVASQEQPKQEKLWNNCVNPLYVYFKLQLRMQLSFENSKEFFE